MKLAWMLQKLFDDAGGICPYSGRKLTLGVDAEIDHREPRSKGGSDFIENLQWVHKVVNQMKYNYSEEDFLAVVAEIYHFKHGSL